ncbi:MAG TPA: ferric reductase-like transmembrane domain-containing protein [Woeseiaceae bacterium]
MPKLIIFLNHRFFVWAILSAPMLVLAVAYARGQMFYGEVLHVSGELSARLLILALAITPLRMIFARARWPIWLQQRRRWFGVASFAYAILHTVLYLERKAEWSAILADGLLFEMWTGWLALGIFLLLALSSNDFSVRLMKRSWKKLHRFVYAATALVFLHWVYTAFDFVSALVHLLILLGLESYRLVRSRVPASANK